MLPTAKQDSPILLFFVEPAYYCVEYILDEYFVHSVIDSSTIIFPLPYKGHVKSEIHLFLSAHFQFNLSKSCYLLTKRPVLLEDLVYYIKILSF